MGSESGADKILVFSIGNEFYGIYINSVREIIRFDSMTPLHDDQKACKGVINLRGKIIPVVDLRIKLGIAFKEYNDKTVLIILSVMGKSGDYNIALAVDAVHEVVLPGEEDMEKIPELGLNLKRKFMYGIMKHDGRMVMILEMSKVIDSEDQEIPMEAQVSE